VPALLCRVEGRSKRQNVSNRSTASAGASEFTVALNFKYVHDLFCCSYISGHWTTTTPIQYIVELYGLHASPNPCPLPNIEHHHPINAMWKNFLLGVLLKEDNRIVTTKT
jgi:hypothetical protein